ncbi:hypothetical protein FDP41_009237 [Naegleria fowleri]|uniref:Uncharacterized protein n=1 Tax=Naegleria fowleri TaxID=5763 RepID=A0A6A5BE23_NAEFO|nr:uncharacterized protein FDP41_009237 [Naegleria fowleri]KAF0972334.1 hypothetical protein FDP41_009237 [Naegleria fowleri]CAG4713432.1 unnamed protein product [Naegleria fowleri]
MSSHTSQVDNTINLLLLGISESGKSTLFKQVKILHQNGYTKEELSSFTKTIQDNLILGMAALMDLVQHSLSQKQVITTSPNNTPFVLDQEQQELLRTHTQHILRKSNDDDKNGSTSSSHLSYDPSKLASLRFLWQHPYVQHVFHQRHGKVSNHNNNNNHSNSSSDQPSATSSWSYPLIDNLAYFMNHCERIGAASYVPSVEDVLHCRLRTTGVHETKFEFGGLSMRLVDVGGQRNQRKKWIHVFDNVTALIFVVSLVEYNQVLEEDPTTIRIRESMLLFEELVNCSVFYDKPVMLFLNKVDLFNDLIKKVDISEQCFKDYHGKKHSAPDAIQFIAEKFKKLRENKDADVFVEVTCAVDTNNIKKVLENLKTIILKESLSSK